MQENEKKKNFRFILAVKTIKGDIKREREREHSNAKKIRLTCRPSIKYTHINIFILEK